MYRVGFFVIKYDLLDKKKTICVNCKCIFKHFIRLNKTIELFEFLNLISVTHFRK